MPFEASVQSSICLQMNECTDMDELEAFDEYGIEKILLEGGRSHAFDYHKRKGLEDSSIVNNPVWCDEILYGDKDGLLKEFGVMTDEDKECIKKKKRNGKLDIGKEHAAWVEHHDAGNEGGGHTTWYRSACIIFRPNANSSCGK